MSENADVSPFPLWNGFRVPPFRYTGRDELRVIHELRSRGRAVVQVVGLPGWGCYEWVVLGDGEVLAHSNEGYGESDVALREGVREWLRREDLEGGVS